MRVRGVRQAIRQQLRPQEAQPRPHERQAVPLSIRRLRQDLHPSIVTEETHEDACHDGAPTTAGDFIDRTGGKRRRQQQQLWRSTLNIPRISVDITSALHILPRSLEREIESLEKIFFGISRVFC